MTSLIPPTWKQSVEDLRDNVIGVFDRVLPPQLRRERSDDSCLTPASVFATGGPAVDIDEDADTVRVTAELPGLSEKDFSVELLNDRLILRGEKKASRERKERDYVMSECSYGSFTRSIPLPCEVDTGKVSAEYKHGVLRVTLPKAEGAKGKRIKIDVS